MIPRHSRRALTNVHIMMIVGGVLLFCLLVVAGLAAILLPALAKARQSARQIKCGTQTRNVIQAMTIFAQGNKDSYPLPSILDASNQTVQTQGRAKDTSDNILSVLVFTCMISPELLVSPAETNSAIVPHTGYQVANPKAAVNPAKALWDPSLRCDFTSGVGNTSYAMAMADGDPDAAESDAKARGRLPQWSNTFNASEAVFGNRGPNVTARDAAGNVQYDTKSNTLGIHGGRRTWEGNIGYNDNHVNFETVMAPPGIVYRSAAGVRPDVIFLNEQDDTTGRNMILGVWVKAGTAAGDYKGIHD